MYRKNKISFKKSIVSAIFKKVRRTHCVEEEEGKKLLDAATTRRHREFDESIVKKPNNMAW